MMASAKKKQDEKNLKILRELASQPHNKKCFDCGQRGPTYVNMTVGSFVCTSCSGILRGLNPPQRVKSISMTSFNPQEIEFLQGAGNEMCKKTWLGLWNSANSPEPESRDEQKVKDFMIQKYERRRWYIPPQQVNMTSSTTSNSVPEAKPLKQLLGKDSPNLQSSSQVQNTTRERPRTASQSSIPSAVPPPVSSLANEPQPVQQKPATSFDLLSDLGGDPFAQPSQPQGFAAFGSPPQQPQQGGGIPGFAAFNQPQPVAPASQVSFDLFGSSQPQQAQPVQPGFANFGQPQQQPQAQQMQQQSSGFDAFGAFSSPVSSAPVSQSSGTGFGPMVSATAASVAPSTNPTQQGSDRYAALSALDNLFGPTQSTSVSSSASHTSTSSGGSVFGSSSGTSLGMSSGPNPFASGGQPAQPVSQAANPFQGLGNVGGSGGGFVQMNGPGRSMSPASSTATGITSSAGFGGFSSVQPSSTSFGQPAAQQPQAGWGGMGGQQSMGMPASSSNQNFSLGVAGATVMAANQFGKLPHQPTAMGGQAGGFGGGQGLQSGFGGGTQMGGSSTMGGTGMSTPASSSSFGQWGQSSAFGTQGGGQSSQLDGFGGQSSGFGSQGSGFGGQSSGFSGQSSGFGGQQSGFGAQQGSFGAQQGGIGGQQGGFGAQPGQFAAQQQGRFPGQGGVAGGGFGGQPGSQGFGGGMMGGQFGQPQQQPPQFGGWGQQGSQPNPFMGGGGQSQMQQQSTNPFM